MTRSAGAELINFKDFVKKINYFPNKLQESTLVAQMRAFRRQFFAAGVTIAVRIAVIVPLGCCGAVRVAVAANGAGCML